MGNLIEKTWQDIYTGNTIKYDKFNGFNFDLDELDDLCVEFNGIQRCVQLNEISK